MKKKKKYIIILMGVILLFFGWRLICKRRIKFQEVCRIKRETAFRLDDGSFFAKEGWVWYSISENPSSGFDSREIDDYLVSHNISLDFEKYTYIVVYGYVLDDLYVRLINSEPGVGDFRKWTAYVCLAPECDPHEVVVYQIDKQYIVNDIQYRNDEPFVHIIR